MNGKRPGGWVALAWRYYRDPKFARVSDAAELLYLRALAYSGEHETDGTVQRTMLFQLRPRARVRVTSLADQLVAAGLWIQIADGYAVPFDTWSRWQETAEQKADGRARTAERQAKWRDGRRVSNASRNALRNATSGSGAVQSTVPLSKSQGVETPEPHVWEENGRLYAALPSPPSEGT